MCRCRCKRGYRGHPPKDFCPPAVVTAKLNPVGLSRRRRPGVFRNLGTAECTHTVLQTSCLGYLWIQVDKVEGICADVAGVV